MFAGRPTLTPPSRAVRLPLMVPRCVPTGSTTDGAGGIPVRRVAVLCELDVAVVSPPSPPCPLSSTSLPSNSYNSYFSFGYNQQLQKDEATGKWSLVTPENPIAKLVPKPNSIGK